MGKLHVCLAVAFITGACGNDHADKVIDAPKMVDAAPDAKVFKDAPIDAAPTYDFSCSTNTPPTTAPAMINIGGTTDTLSLGGSAALGSASVAAYANGSSTPLVAGVTSAADGTYTLSNVPTGDVPVAGFVEANGPTGGSAYRTTFVYPPYPLAATTTAADAIMVSMSSFEELETVTATQTDTTNGAVLVEVTDCANKLISTATLSVTTTADTTKQVGMQFGLAQLDAAYAGVFLVLNVPAGAIDIGASYGTQTLHTVTAVAYSNGQGPTPVVNGSITATIVRPGPAN